MNNTPVTEDELQAKAKGRRVTAQDVLDAIASESYFRAGQAADNAARLGQTGVVDLDSFNALQCLTFCTIVLTNGFTVTGQSACADPNNYDAELGQRLARQDAVNKIWAFLGFVLREDMARDQDLITKRAFTEQEGFGVFIGTKVVHATPMSRAIYNDFRGWTMPANEEDDEGYLVEYTDGGQANVEGMAGYISWSPKDVFERAYRAVGAKESPSASEGSTPAAGKAAEARAVKPEEKKEETWVDRLMAEFHEQHARLTKLEQFIAENKFQDLAVEDRDLLIEQYRHMVGYHRVLSERVGRANSLTLPQVH